MLPKPKDTLGYTKEEISVICKERKIPTKKFWNAFGINTVAVAKDGSSRFYQCDVENALYKLHCKDGIWHPWD